MEMTEHYYSEKQTSEKRETVIQFKLRNRVFSLRSASATFSPAKLDTGTGALLKYAEIPDEGNFLDLGCGYGPIGIVVALTTKCDVVMSDVNKRALTMAKKNARQYGIKVKIVKSFIFEDITGLFDCILSNPPMAAGKKVVFAMISGSFDHLKKDGSLQMVARAKKGGKSIKEEMLKIFGNCEIIGRQSGFHVYKSIKNK